IPHRVRTAPRYGTRSGATKRAPICLRSLDHIVTSALYAAAAFWFETVTSRSVSRNMVGAPTPGATAKCEAGGAACSDEPARLAEDAAAAAAISPSRANLGKSRFMVTSPPITYYPHARRRFAIIGNSERESHMATKTSAKTGTKAGGKTSGKTSEKELLDLENRYWQAIKNKD